MQGTIRLCLGFLLMLGAVGGMDDPSLVDYFIFQVLVAVAGAALAVWGVTAMIKHRK